MVQIKEVKPAVKPLKTINELSTRQLEVVRLLMKGKPNKEIAHALGLTEGTIKEYIYHIFQATGASNRTEVAIMAATQLQPLYL